MKQRFARILPLLAVFLTSLLALGGSLGAAVLAQAGATRVAVFATSETWAQIEATGLPVVRLALGGMLIVVDGSGAPLALARLRQATPYVMDASLVPGCDAPNLTSLSKVSS